LQNLKSEIKHPKSLYLVTGGAGFIGSNIVEELVQQGERVRVLDNFSTGERENLTPWLDRIELIEDDIHDSDGAAGERECKATGTRVFYAHSSGGRAAIHACRSGCGIIPITSCE
jgi:nucleoside-diphosphate-sugar epimerase